MKQLLIALVGAAALVGCGVDRDGTRDNIVDAMQENGIEVDSDCVDEVLDGYSDDQLEAIDDDETVPHPRARRCLPSS